MSETIRVYRTPAPFPAADVFAWHTRPGAFERLAPPWMNVQVVDARGGIAPGDHKTLRIAVGPLKTNWRVVHEAPAEGLGFNDIQESGPFASWRHEHRFIPDGPDRSVIEDRLIYRLPAGAAGRLVTGRSVARGLDDVFHFRHRRTLLDLTRLSDPRLQTPLRVAITGSTGLVGSQLAALLTSGGHTVIHLVRHAPQGDNEARWDPASGQIDAARLEGLDAVVHLAGASIAGGRWTSARKRAIHDSRVEGTTLLAKTLAGLQRPPRVLVSTSAVGYYGDSGDQLLTEDSANGSGFLADVCRVWEESAAPAEAAGIRVVHPRFGVVMTARGGMLALLTKLFRFGLGGPAGSGRQYLSWIALDDLLGVILETIANDTLSGPVNAVAPEAVTNAEFGKTLGRVLHRPAFMPAPAPALRLALGGLADELLLASQRTSPANLEAAGFQYAFPTLEAAVRHELGRVNSAGFALPIASVNQSRWASAAAGQLGEGRS